MLYRDLGTSGLKVSEIGFGCASWWGRPAFSERDAVGLVDLALDRGVTLFDTGPGYSRGAAEGRLGRALSNHRTDDLIISTKAGTTFHQGRVVRDMSPPAIEASLLKSLGRLGLKQVSLMQLHGPSAAELTEPFLAFLGGLKRKGLTRLIGVNSFDPLVIAKAISLPEIDVVMLDYNLLRPERASLIAEARRAGKGVLAGMPLAMGHTGRKVMQIRAPRDIWYALRALRHHRRDIVDGARFDFLDRFEGLTGSQAALAWVLENEHIASAVTGTTRTKHLIENLRASGLELPEPLRLQIAKAQSEIPR